ncbi:VCBS repeat-containing protein [Bradyrhizobium elkanii]|uniref:VCBS domain-containing protein n=1 Tax=Bradyrhizobium elkanii TaxID=29448 RepID=UPI00351931F0
MRVRPDDIINGFDSSFYLLTQPDVAAAGVDPQVHFDTYGWHEGRLPDGLFDPVYYLAQNPDVAAAGVDPLQHYLQYGASEGRNPSAAFNTAAYLAANPDVAAAHVNPLQHYLQYGAFEGRSGGANLTVGTSGNDYLIGTSGSDQINAGAGNDFVIAAGGNDIVDGGAGIDTARFSSDFSAYTFSFLGNQVVVDGPEGHDVFTNIERFAFRDGTIGRNDNNLLVDDLYYYASNRDVWAAGVDAATHYAQSGWHEGRNPNQYFDTNYYLANNPDVAAAGIDPLQHYLTYGGFEGRNPSALFNTTAYLAAYPDVAAAHVNPLLHFLEYGQSEGRSPVGNYPALIGDPAAHDVTEDSAAPSLIATGTLSIADADDGEASFQTTVISASGNLGSLTLDANGDYVYSVANSATQSLGATDIKVDTFTVTSLDGTTKHISFTIHGADDAPVIGDPLVHHVTEDAASPTLTAVGTISISDVDQNQAAFQTTVTPTTGNLGSLTLAANGDYTYSVANSATQYLTSADTKIDTFTIVTADGTAKQVSFTIHGADDVAVIGNPSVAEVIEDDASPTLTATGSISISDPDQGQAAFQTTVTPSLGNLGSLILFDNGTYTYSVDNSLTQMLGASDVKVDSFTVTTIDGTTKQISFTIHGTNDVAVIGDPVLHDVTEDAAAPTLTATGTLSISDADQNQASFQATVTPASGTIGSLTLAANGDYTYSVANSATQYLSAIDTKVETFTVTAADGTTHDITFNIHGAQDAPNLMVGASATGPSDANISLSLAASLVDLSSTLHVQLSGIPSSFLLSQGALQEDGSWLLSAADLSAAAQSGGLVLIPQSGAAPGNFSIHVTAISDDGSNQAYVSNDIAVTVTQGASQQSGQLIDGYIAGATVFADANNNGVFDAGEVSTTTNADGSFTLTGGSGPLVSIGGTDVSTGLQFTGTLKAPEGSSVITPLTTLIASLVESTASSGTPLTAAEAAVAVKTAFNIDLSIDLTTFDPVPLAAQSDATATAVLSAAIQVQATVTQVSAVGASATSVFSAIGTAIVTAQADPINNPAFDLSSSSTVQSVVSDSGVTGAAVSVVVDVVSAANTSIQAATDVTTLAQASQVAQGAAAQQLAATDFNDAQQVADLQQTYVTDLSTQVSNAVVGDVDGAQLGTLGNDVLTGGSGNDSIDGLDGNDQILGLDGNDFLYGGAGKDLLTGGAGDDHLDGGAGFDRAIYTDATGSVTINLAAGTASGAGVGNDSLVSIEAVVGSDFADTFNAAGFVGNSGIPGTPIGFNEFEGKGGDDTIISAVNAFGAQLTRVSYVSATAGVTVDIAAGTADGDASVGHDSFVGPGIIGAWGSAFADTLLGSNNGFGTVEVFDGRAGNDTINGRGGFDRADYNNDPSTTSGITINLAAGTVIGDATVGTDTLISVEAVRGTNFADTYNAAGFSGSSSNAGSNGTFNEFNGFGGDDIITGNGNTRLSYNAATAGVTVDIAAGTADGDGSVGHDTFSGVNAIMGSMFADHLSGSSGNETFTGLGGDDVIDGRGGFDTVSYNNIYQSTGSVSIDLASGTVTGDSTIGTDTLRSIEGIQGTVLADSYDATGYGLAGALNVGNNGNFNQFEGLGGNDTITGNGNTRLLYTNATAGVSINMQAGTASGDSSVGTDSFVGVNSAGGSAFVDTYDATGFTGTTSAGSFGTFNAFQGLGGNDTIIGNGFTQIQYNNASGGVTVDLAAGTATGDASVGTDSFVGVNSATGSNFADIYDATGFTGTTSAGSFGTFNAFQGGGGNDTITGNGNTQIQYGGATAAVTVDLAAGTATGDGSVGTDTITGGVNSVAGSNFNDTILGGSGDEFLSGGAGNDTINGRGGADVLSGNAGADTFVYATGGGADQITDFNHGQGDKIDVSNVAGIFNFADIQSHAAQVGPNTVITFGGGDSITLQNVTLGDLVAADFVFASGGSTLVGDAGNNTLTGTANADSLSGLAGNDRLQGLGGNDLLDGGADFDRAVYSDATGGVTINLAAGTASGAGVGTDILVNIEGAVGSDFADTFNAAGFTGNSGTPGTPIGFNEFEGRGGNDTIISALNSLGAQLTRVSYVSATAGVTVDLLAGTADGNASVGHDTLIGSGFNGVWGSAYDDTIKGTDNVFATAEVFAGFAGNDLIDGRGGFDRADYNVDATTTSGITVNLAAGTVTGDATVGTDTLRSIEAVRGTNLADTYDATGFSGTSLNAGSLGTFNEFTGNGGDDTIVGNGNTRLGFNNATGGVNVDFVTGIASGDVSVGTDHFTGVNAVQASMFDDTLLGGTTNDTFTGLAGNDSIDGRGGFDTSSYNNIFFTTGGVSVNMAAGTVVGDASTGTDTLRSIEGIQGTNFADSYDATGYGLAGALNVGNNGNFNQFEGLGGNDTITGNGNTRLLYTNATAGVSINMQAGTASGDSSVGTDSFVGVNSAGGSAFVDTYDATGFTGTTSAGSFGTFNAFQGLGGNDTIIGNGFTQIQYNNASGGVTVDLAAGTATGDASVGTDSFVGVNSATGSNFADIYDATGFTGTTSAGSFGTFNAFQGGGGNDTITGNGNTQIQYGGATAAVTVDLAAGTATGDGSVGTDTITGGVNSVAGSNFNDTILGGSGDEFLSGGAGNDTINGRGGADVLSGNAGADTFVYATGGGADQITDFNHGQGDKIDVSNVAGIFNFADIQSHAAQVGPNTVITFGGGDSITLQNVTLGDLVAADFVFASGGSTLVGDAGNNTLTGTANADSLSGLAGNDRLQGLGGNDLLDGGADFDRAVYSDATGGVTINLAAGTASGAGVGTDILVNIEGAVGSDFADTFNAAGFTGNSGTPGTPIGFNEFEGRGGNDTIISALNSLGAQLTRVSYVSATSGVTVDIAAGTADGDASVGHDSFFGTGIAGIVGSNLADTLLGSSNGFGTVETFDGRGGNDTFDGRGGFDRADYNNDPSTTSGITINLAAGTVIGDAAFGTDTLISVEPVRGTSFVDTYNAAGFSGSSSNAGSNGTFNEFNGFGGDDIITGNGNTRLSYNAATAGVTVDIAAGTADGDGSVGHDTFSGVNAIMGSMFADHLSGSSGNETFTGLGGDDVIDGRGGFDTVSYNNIYQSTGSVSIDLASGTVTGDSTIGTDTLRSIEGIQGTVLADSYDATGYGLAGALNVGNNGNFNQFEGLGGNDTITGNGNTRLLYTNATAGVSINMQAGTASGDSSVGTDSFVGVNSAGGSAFADTYDATGFTGTTSAGSFGTFNAFQGLGGNDTIIGNGFTQIQYNSASGGVTVDLAAGTATGDASVGADSITGGVNGVVGSNFNDTISGSDANESLAGAAGADVLNGAGGNDLLTGGAGNDTIDGGTGGDVAVYTGPSSAYTITPLGGGEFQVADSNSARDGTDALSNVEVLQFSDTIMMLTPGTTGAPVDISGVNLSGSAPIVGTSGNDFLTIDQTAFAHPIDLGSGDDTVNLRTGNYNLNLVGVEHLASGNGDDFVMLSNSANGISLDLGGGDDHVALANGVNALSVSNVEGLAGTDFGAALASDDTLTLLNDVNGLIINLANGSNTLNLASGTNAITTFNIQTINGTASDDALTLQGQIGGATIDLGNGTDTLTLADGFNDVTAKNVETVVGSNGNDNIVIANTTGSTTVAGGLGVDTITADAATDNFRFASAAESVFGNGDTIVGFDADHDAFQFTSSMVGGANGLTGAISFVGTSGFDGTPAAHQSEARLDLTGGQTTLQIDVDGDGQLTANDIEIHLTGATGTLTSANFMLI